MPHKHVHIEFKLEHVSCLVGNSLIRMDSGDNPRELLPIHIDATNNILASSSSSPLIAMSGNVDPRDFRQKWLRWNGLRNFYDDFKMFWSMTSAQPFAGTVELDFKAWQDRIEAGAVSEGVAWLTDRSETPYRKLRLADFELDPKADPVKFPAGGDAANDGSAVGVNFDNLRDFPVKKPAITEKREE